MRRKPVGSLMCAEPLEDVLVRGDRFLDAATLARQTRAIAPPHEVNGSPPPPPRSPPQAAPPEAPAEETGRYRTLTALRFDVGVLCQFC